MKQTGILIFLAGALILLGSGCSGRLTSKDTIKETIKTNVSGSGENIYIEVAAGKSHNHPSMAIWLEDMEGNFIQTLYVTQSIATGIFGHGQKNDTTWLNEPGIARRPATLPYWLHKRGVLAPDGTYLPTPQNPVPDAYTGATPKQNFSLMTKADKHLPDQFRVLMEVNQPWDWNKHWHNTLYPDDNDYKTSCQPSVIYAVTVQFDKAQKQYFLNPIGHGHYSGKDGELYTDLSTLTTALEIIENAFVTLK